MEKDNNQVSDQLHYLTFNVQRSSRYHIARRRFYEGWHQFTVAVGLIFGSTAIATFLSPLAILYSVITGAFVPVTHAVDLVLRTVAKSRLHHDLSNEFMELEKEIIRSFQPTRSDIAEWKARVIDIETREPPRKKVLNILMHNEVCLATGREEYLYKVGWIRRFFAHLVSLNPDGIKRKKQTEELVPKTPGQLKPA